MTTRRVPIDFDAVAEETGIRRGKIFYSELVHDWCVMSTCDAPVICMTSVTPPPAEPGETLTIEGNDWVFTKETEG